MQVSLYLTLFRRNVSNYQENDRFLEYCFRLSTMPKVCRSRFLSFFGTGHVTQKLKFFFFFFFFFFLKFHWVWHDIGGMLRIIKKMPDFWKIILGSTEFFLEVSLSLTWCWRKVPNYQKNSGFLEDCFKL